LKYTETAGNEKNLGNADKALPISLVSSVLKWQQLVSKWKRFILRKEGGKIHEK
jgi:hypothetical protein